MSTETVFDLDRIAAGLPAGALANRVARLAADGPGFRAVLEAPPGTGKTTVIPPAVAQSIAEAAAAPARVLVSQPRRVAARAAAGRLASLSGQEVGGAVGYTVRGDRRVSGRTQVEFATTGVVLRRLLRDPELTGVDAVILDEVHERSLESDLAFAMLRELVDLRDDLTLLVMSATLDAKEWAVRLGGDTAAPVLRVEAASHPLTVRWSPPPRRAVDDRGVRSDFLTHLAGTVRRALQEDDGDVLVFAPGHREVDRIASLVTDRHRDIDVLTLTGSTPRKEQDRVLSGGEHSQGQDHGRGHDQRHGQSQGRSQGRSQGQPRRRVVVATSVAESALTVPSVRIVVDSCLARVPYFDTGRGLGGLTTVRESKAAGDQRAGRAAREAAGTVWRCCAEADWAAFPAHTSPEVLTADLTGAVLDLAVWGSPGGAGLPLPTPLPALSLSAATQALHGLGALESADARARATEFGRALARVPADPRTARGLLLGAPVIGPRAAAECAALLSLDVRGADGDLAETLQRARTRRDRVPDGWKREARRLERLAEEHAPGGPAQTGPSQASPPQVMTPQRVTARGGSASSDLGIVLALSRPDMIARLRGGAEDDYLLVSGTGGELQRGSSLRGAEWIAVADVGIVGGRALIRAGVAIDEETALWAGASLRATHESAHWTDGRIRARRTDSLGAITLSSTPVAVTEDSAHAGIRDAVRSALARLADGESPGTAFDGIASADEAESFATLRGRLGLLHVVVGEPWPDVRATVLADTCEDWLGNEIRRAARALAAQGSGGGKRAARLRLDASLQGLLPWPEAAKLDRLVPVRVPVPSGSAVRLRYPRPEEHTATDGDTSASSDAEDLTTTEAAEHAGIPRTAGGSGITPPVLAVKLQEMFGAADGPAVVDGRVPILVHLLSPAHRPLAVTADLASFWEGAYAHVRAENRNRYRKHPWPEDPTTAAPTKHTSKRASGTQSKGG